MAPANCAHTTEQPARIPARQLLWDAWHTGWAAHTKATGAQASKEQYDAAYGAAVKLYGHPFGGGPYTDEDFACPSCGIHTGNNLDCQDDSDFGCAAGRTHNALMLRTSVLAALYGGEHYNYLPKA